MTLHVTLSLDYSEVYENRDEFYKFLQDDGWEKLKHVDTVWKKVFNYLSSDQEAVDRELYRLLKGAAHEFKPFSIEYIAQIGNHEPIERRLIQDSIGSYDYYRD